jgi:hypothetical protein
MNKNVRCFNVERCLRRWLHFSSRFNHDGDGKLNIPLLRSLSVGNQRCVSKIDEELASVTPFALCAEDARRDIG